MENDRLIQELRLLQEQSLLAQNRRKSDKEGRTRSYHKPPEPKAQKELHLHFDVFGNQSVNSNPLIYNPTRHNIKPVRSLPTKQPDWDARSYYSEPSKRPRTKVIMYKAFHKEDGSVKISRANSFITEGNPRPAFVPPLDLKKLSSPKKGYYPNLFEKAKNYQSTSYQKQMGMEPRIPPFSRKLSHVSEGHEPDSKPQTGHVVHLPVIDDQGQGEGSRSVSPMKQMKHDDGNQAQNLHVPEIGRPESDVSLHIPEGNADQDSRRGSPAQGSPAPDVAWQVNRSSPGPQKPLYSYGYDE